MKILYSIRNMRACSKLSLASLLVCFFLFWSKYSMKLKKTETIFIDIFCKTHTPTSQRLSHTHFHWENRLLFIIQFILFIIISSYYIHLFVHLVSVLFHFRLIATTTMILLIILYLFSSSFIFLMKLFV